MIVGNPWLDFLPHKDGFKSVTAKVADDKPYHWKPFKCVACGDRIVFDSKRLHGNPYCRACFPHKELEAVRIRRWVFNKT